MKQLDLFGNQYVADPDRDCWATPQAFFDELNAEFNFTVDACASRMNRKCSHYFDEQMDALSVDWCAYAKANDLRSVFWMNPPYSNPAIKNFMRKAYEESLNGATVVCLVLPSVCSQWWHNYAMKGEIRYIPHRVNFVPPPGVEASTNRWDNLLVIFRPLKISDRFHELRRLINVFGMKCDMHEEEPKPESLKAYQAVLKEIARIDKGIIPG